jgi:PHD/YefM family antitoxin component YafN of YafNO toxin-antitoxin module
MSLQIIQGGNGKPAGVFIPMNDWEMMKAEYQNLEAWEEREPTKAEILAGIKEAVEEVKLIRAGKLKASSLQDLLDEL